MSALEALAAAQRIYAAAGGRSGAAAVLNEIASTHMEHGELDTARKGYEDAIAIQRR